MGTSGRKDGERTMGHFWDSVRQDFRARRARGEFRQHPITWIVSAVTGVPWLVLPFLALFLGFGTVFFLVVVFGALSVAGVQWLWSPFTNPDHPARFPEEWERQKSLPRGMRLPRRMWDEYEAAMRQRATTEQPTESEEAADRLASS